MQPDRAPSTHVRQLSSSHDDVIGANSSLINTPLTPGLYARIGGKLDNEYREQGARKPAEINGACKPREQLEMTSQRRHVSAASSDDGEPLHKSTMTSLLRHECRYTGTCQYERRHTSDFRGHQTRSCRGNN